MLFKKTEVQQVSNVMMNMLHEEEIEIVNNFHDAVVAKDIDKIDELFKVLIYDVEDHFSTEEDMMEESQFYAAAIHKAEHDSMRKKVQAIEAAWNTNKDPKEVQNFLESDFKSWMVLHVARWDSETAMHLGDSI
ncbi:MAG: Bacteriohemerythrin [uncultured Sulfurovum sp.]|uniref:Bacteriohemerythrin n=1 Tax=uncultured Sulfurovum sp. TaxID=269237 RepID=A0A6S6THM2_9BACT|nr:MAG: Bacteriohemerythrin [uncultured Sulfurovum sp.]